MMVGNWGERAEKQVKHSKANSEDHDRQIMGCPAQILVLCKASNSVADMLGRPPKCHDDERPQSRPQKERAPTGNVKRRDWHEHHVMIGHPLSWPHERTIARVWFSIVVNHGRMQSTEKKGKRGQLQPKQLCAHPLGSRTSGTWARRLSCVECTAFIKP